MSDKTWSPISGHRNCYSCTDTMHCLRVVYS